MYLRFYLLKILIIYIGLIKVNFTIFFHNQAIYTIGRRSEILNGSLKDG